MRFTAHVKLMRVLWNARYGKLLKNYAHKIQIQGAELKQNTTLWEIAYCKNMLVGEPKNGTSCMY